MIRKIGKYLKFVVSLILILSLIVPSHAALSASDGSAFVSKAEFDSALADFNARLTTFEAGINSKIDSQVTSYLDRNGIWSGKLQTVNNKWPSTRVVLNFEDGYNIVPVQKNTTIKNYYWWGELYTPDYTEVSMPLSTGWKMRWDAVSIKTNDMGCISATSTTELPAGDESGIWVMKDTMGPWYESQIRNGYTDVLYFIADKSGLANIDFFTNPAFNNPDYDALYWSGKDTNFVSYNGNLNQAAILKEWHMRGFRDYEINETSKKIIKPTVTDNSDVDYTLSSHNLALLLNRTKPVFDTVYSARGPLSTTTTDMKGNKSAFELIKAPSHGQQVSNFFFVSKDWLYTIEIYTGCYDSSNRCHFGNDRKPCITYLNTEPIITIY